MTNKKFEQRDNTFSIFKNKFKKTFKQPDFTGKLRFDNQDNSIALWSKDDKIQGKISIGFVDKDNTGLSVEIELKKNPFKKEDKHPDRIAGIVIDGVAYSVAAWNKVSQNGLKYLTGSIKEKSADVAQKEPQKLDNNDSVFDF